MLNNRYNFKDTTEIYHVVKYLLNKSNIYVDICETPIYVSPDEKDAEEKILSFKEGHSQIEKWVEFFVEQLLLQSDIGGVIFHKDVIPNIGTNKGLTWRYLTLSKEEVEMIK